MESGRYPIRIPDILSISRIVLSVPLAIALVMASEGEVGDIVPISLFIILLMTDVVDGHIARCRGVDSHRGMILDVVADVVMSTASSAALEYSGIVPPILPYVIAMFGTAFLLRITVFTSFRGGYDPLGKVCGILTMCLPVLVLLPEHTYGGFVTALSAILIVMMVVSMLTGTVCPLVRRHRSS